MNEHLFTSESVSEGHPDKVCDQISDTVVDLFLSRSRDPENIRVACETLATKNLVIVAGEVRESHETDAKISSAEIEQAVRDTVRDIGYESEGFHWESLDFDCRFQQQSPDIARGVDATVGDSGGEGAGDQGLMFGYACRETESLMPAAIHYSHEILRQLSRARKNGKAKGLGPDAKSQVTLRYENGKPKGADAVVVSSQHDENLGTDDVRMIVLPIVEAVLPKGWMPAEERILVNPTGRFVEGGPASDTGLTGRKIIVDTYGGSCPHGGGAFSGKDPTKVDRSAAYAVRYLAKNVVAAGLANTCTIQVAYAIGEADPVSVRVLTDGSSHRSDSSDLDRALEKALPEVFSLRPGSIRERLGLLRSIYRRSATYGHFGRAPENDGGFSWERIDLVDAIRAAVD